MQTISYNDYVSYYLRPSSGTSTPTVSISLPQKPIVAYVKINSWIDEYSSSSSKQNLRGSEGLYMKLTQSSSYTSIWSGDCDNSSGNSIKIYGRLYNKTINIYAYRSKSGTASWYAVVSIKGIDIIW